MAAALAEVEEWEALRARIRFCPFCAHGYEWQDSDPVEGPCAGCARAEAAEAEADRLKAALKNIGYSLENIADPYNERIGPLKVWANESLERVRAALAPADRNTD